MDSIFLGLMGGVAGLLLVAAIVAGWEHLRRNVRPQDEFASATPKAISIDLRLDRLAAQPAPAARISSPVADIAQRRAALDNVLARLAQPPGADNFNSPVYWAETTPMVAPGQLDAQEPVAGKRPPEFSASQ